MDPLCPLTPSCCSMRRPHQPWFAVTDWTRTPVTGGSPGPGSHVAGQVPPELVLPPWAQWLVIQVRMQRSSSSRSGDPSAAGPQGCVHSLSQCRPEGPQRS